MKLSKIARSLSQGVSRRVLVGIVVAIIVMSLLPLLLSARTYLVTTAAIILMYVGLSQAWNVFSGFSGYISFGHQVFFGAGAYTLAILAVRTNFSVHPLVYMLCAGIIAMAFAFMIGTPTLRLRGAYFSIASLIASEAVSALILNTPAWTNGAVGISLRPEYNLFGFYYIMLTLSVVGIVGALKVKNSDFGLTLHCIKDDEVLASNIGINCFKIKLLALLYSSVFFGIAGAAYGWYTTYVSPSFAFASTMQANIMTMAIFGGLGRIPGVLIGAVILSVINEALWSNFPTLFLLGLGIIIIVMMRYKPAGLLGILEDLVKRIRRRSS